MDKVTRIIREEIDRMILRETVDVSPLSNYIDPLKNCAQQIRNIGTTNNQDIDKFIGNFVTYIFQVIFGIDRCVKANSLNEGLESYGINYPAELGGNFLRDFESGFYKGANWANRKLNGRNNVGNANVDNETNPNNVPSVKLSVSLRNLQQYAFQYQNLSGRYQNILSQHTATFYEAFTQLSNLNSEYNNMVNAQGTNP